jgi:hypothetical protein
MRNRLVYFAALLVLAAVVSKPASAGENTANTSQQQTDNKPADVNARVDQIPARAPKHYYKLDFVLREADEGKVVNQRTFTMNVAVDPPQAEKPMWWNLRSGTRLPVPDTSGKGITYVDVGVNLDVRAINQPNGLEMEITSDISSAGTESGNTAPPIRQVKVKSAVLAPIGKPTVVFTADDPASRHQFELQVTPVPQK